MAFSHCCRWTSLARVASTIGENGKGPKRHGNGPKHQSSCCFGLFRRCLRPFRVVHIRECQLAPVARHATHSPVDPSKDGELRVYAAERVTGTFERAIRLPEFVDSEKIAAELRDGLLTVTIPKATAAQPRKIEISTAPNELADPTGRLSQ